MRVLGCAQVWMQLEEKQIPYTLEKINMRSYGDKPPHFLAKVSECGRDCVSRDCIVRAAALVGTHVSGIRLTGASLVVGHHVTVTCQAR